MNPYPFALLNHFTVPFIRSTRSPSFRTSFSWGKPKDVPALKMHFRAIGMGCQDKWVFALQIAVRYETVTPGFSRTCRSSHKIEEIVLASRIVPFMTIPTAAGRATIRLRITSSSSG